MFLYIMYNVYNSQTWVEVLKMSLFIRNGNKSINEWLLWGGAHSALMMSISSLQVDILSNSVIVCVEVEF